MNVWVSMQSALLCVKGMQKANCGSCHCINFISNIDLALLGPTDLISKTYIMYPIYLAAHVRTHTSLWTPHTHNVNKNLVYLGDEGLTLGYSRKILKNAFTLNQIQTQKHVHCCKRQMKIEKSEFKSRTLMVYAEFCTRPTNCGNFLIVSDLCNQQVTNIPT